MFTRLMSWFRRGKEGGNAFISSRPTLIVEYHQDVDLIYCKSNWPEPASERDEYIIAASIARMLTLMHTGKLTPSMLNSFPKDNRAAGIAIGLFKAELGKPAAADDDDIAQPVICPTMMFNNNNSKE